MAALATGVQAKSSKWGQIPGVWAAQGRQLFKDPIPPLPFSCWQSLAGTFAYEDRSLVKQWIKEGRDPLPIFLLFLPASLFEIPVGK